MIIEDLTTFEVKWYISDVCDVSDVSDGALPHTFNTVYKPFSILTITFNCFIVCYELLININHKKLINV